MWFKNMQVFRLLESLPFDAEDFNQKLADVELQPCARTQLSSQGWVSPFGRDSEVMLHAAGGCWLFSLGIEEKLLPATVISQAVEDKASEIEAREGHKMSRKRRLSLRDETIFSLLPQAFSRRSQINAYFDTQQNFLIIDTSSLSKAEDFCSMLRKTIGSLKIVPLKTKHNPSLVMTKWLVEQRIPEGFLIEDSCEMVDADRDAGVIRCTHQDLSTHEIVSHLKSGKQLSRLGLNWRDKLSFVLAEDLSIKRIKFLDLIREQHDTSHVETKAEQLDADFSLMIGEFRELWQDIFNSFAGLDDADGKVEAVEEVTEALEEAVEA